MTPDPRPFLRDLLAVRPCSFLADRNLWDRAEELLRSLPEDGGETGATCDPDNDNDNDNDNDEFEI